MAPKRTLNALLMSLLVVLSSAACADIYLAETTRRRVEAIGRGLQDPPTVTDPESAATVFIVRGDSSPAA